VLLVALWWAQSNQVPSNRANPNKYIHGNFLLKAVVSKRSRRQHIKSTFSSTAKAAIKFAVNVPSLICNAPPSRGFQWGFSVSSQRINMNQMGTHKSASAPSASPRWMTRVWFVMHRQVAKYAEHKQESNLTSKRAYLVSASTAKAAIKFAVNVPSLICYAPPILMMPWH